MRPADPAAKSCMLAGELVFVDSNVLLYSMDPADAGKRSEAQRWLYALWQSGLGRISWQVLIEFYASAVRKLVDGSGIRKTVRLFSRWQPGEPGLLLIERAWYWCDESQISFWDAMIVAAAERAGCKWLLSEDFQPDRKFGAITVVSPFEVQPEDLA